jgi:peptidoglycan/xylan/chitin deacetylase (PgdA/CDA1 family)
MKKLFVLFALILILSCAKTGVYSSGKKANDGFPLLDKLCALTFDDGPSSDPELTPMVLDKLEAYGIVATFFLVGQNVNDSTKEVIDRIVANGHEIGNHSWSYDDMAEMSADEVKKSVSDTTKSIQKYSGVTPLFFRAPNLSTSSTMFSTIDLPFAGGVVAGDWPGGGGDTTEHIMKKLLDGIRDGVIIILHDVQPKPHPTPEALDTLIPRLKDEGYEFVTLSELFDRRGIVPDAETETTYVYVE